MTERVGPWRRRPLTADFVACVAAAMLCSACSGPEDRPRAESAADKVEAQIVDRARFDKLLGERRGQVVLVDFWADWCEPCINNFPHMIELANRARERGLAVVTVNVNAPEAAERTVEFLKLQGAGASTNLISRYDGAVKSMSAFDIPSGLPCYRIYDRQGKLRHTFSVDPAAERQFSLQDLDAAIEQLLAE